MSIHAFISSWFDYCNSSFTCLNQSSINRPQRVQNAAAKSLTRSKLSCHITPVLATCHWLPVQFRTQYKLLLLTYKASHSFTSATLFTITPPRSSYQSLLSVPRTLPKTKGDRSFGAVAPRLWNALPLDLRSAQSVNSFKGQLTTHLYRQEFEC